MRFGWQVDKFDDDEQGVTVKAEALTGESKGARENGVRNISSVATAGAVAALACAALPGFAKLDARTTRPDDRDSHARADLYKDHLAHKHVGNIGW